MKTIGLTRIFADEIHDVSTQEKPLTTDAIEYALLMSFMALV